MDKVETIFDLLDAWRGLPSYQLERRADIFFAFYLPEIIKGCFNEDITHDSIIPEYPLKKAGNRQSNKVDYAVFCKERIYLIELKTDSNSLNETQHEYLKEAKSKSLFDLISIIPEIAIGSEQREKYMHLIGCLKKVLCKTYGIKITSESNVSDTKKKAFDALMQEFDENKKDFDANKTDIEIVYIVPKNDENVEKSKIKEIGKIITFEEIRKWLPDSAKRFRESLKVWDDTHILIQE